MYDYYYTEYHGDYLGRGLNRVNYTGSPTASATAAHALISTYTPRPHALQPVVVVSSSQEHSVCCVVLFDYSLVYSSQLIRSGPEKTPQIQAEVPPPIAGTSSVPPQG